MISLIIFYYLYLLMVFVFLLYSLFNLYHLLRFGFASLTNILVILIYIIVSCLLLIFSFSLLLSIDWSAPLIDFSAYRNYFPKL